MSTITPIVVVEDRALLAMSIAEQFRHGQSLLQPYNLDGTVQIVASGRRLLRWLDSQPAHSVRLLLMDFTVADGESTDVLRSIRDPRTGQFRHASMHPDALVIGWSASSNSAIYAFQACGADGFISKQRPIKQLVADVLTVVTRRRAGESWIELA